MKKIKWLMMIWFNDDNNSDNNNNNRPNSNSKSNNKNWKGVTRTGEWKTCITYSGNIT